MFTANDYHQLALYDKQCRESSRGEPEPGPGVIQAERHIVAYIKAGNKKAPDGVPQAWYSRQIERYTQE